MILCLYFSRRSVWWTVGLAMGSLPLVAVLAMLAPYRLRRLTAYLDPWQDPQGAGYHTVQSLYALAQGGVFGAGVGMSREKFFYLPQPHTDFIFTVISNEFGWVGASILLALFLVFSFSVLRMLPGEEEEARIGVVYAHLILLEVFFNSGVGSALLPVTGVTLPFISYGGTSLLTHLLIVATIYRFSRSPAPSTLRQ